MTRFAFLFWTPFNPYSFHFLLYVASKSPRMEAMRYVYAGMLSLAERYWYSGWEPSTSELKRSSEYPVWYDVLIYLSNARVVGVVEAEADVIEEEAFEVEDAFRLDREWSSLLGGGVEEVDLRLEYTVSL
jgi:hypothetical protein